MNVSKALIVLGFLLFFFGGYLTYQRYSPKNLEFQGLQVSKNVSSDEAPVRISIPSLNIDNAVFPASIKKGNWESTTKGISYLSSSPTPGSGGNSILYGHNWPSLLGDLIKIKPGDKIEILMSNGEKKNFIVKFTSVVDPSQTHVLNQTTDARITVYTCTGFLDTKRFVATAILTN